MAHTRTIVLTPSVVEREATTYTSATGFDNTGLAQYFSRASRPAYRFTIRMDALTKSQAESLSALHAVLQGGQSFFWDGGPWGDVQNMSLVGEGDSQRRDFFLGNRNVGAGSISVQTLRGAVSSAWATSSANGWPYSLTAVAGVVSFANSTNTIPASGDDVMARWGCRYRCHFEPDGIVIENEHRGVFSVELKLTETAFTG